MNPESRTVGRPKERYQCAVLLRDSGRAYCAMAAGLLDSPFPLINRKGETSPALARTSRMSLCSASESGMGPSRAVTTQSEHAMSRITQLEQSINMVNSWVTSVKVLIETLCSTSDSFNGKGMSPKVLSD